MRFFFKRMIVLKSIFSLDFCQSFNWLMFILGCNWYGFGAIFFGCLSMLLHGTISFTRYKTIVRPHDRKLQFFELIDLSRNESWFLSSVFWKRSQGKKIRKETFLSTWYFHWVPRHQADNFYSNLDSKVDLIQHF